GLTRGIGVMSGTSLDGLDFAFCNFEATAEFKLLAFCHFPYPDEILKLLKIAPEVTGIELLKTEQVYSNFVAQKLVKFMKSLEHLPQFIACHGHTVFHQPESNFTFQMLNGNIVAAETGIPCIADFRRLDVALGGQGAPLVPVGDQILFSSYDACLNLGGFANASVKNSKGTYAAFDICPVNIAMNALAEKLGMSYDKDGIEAGKGQIVQSVLNQLNDLPFYALSGPKSLGREWLEREVSPLLDLISDERDALRTWVEHASVQIGRALKDVPERGKILCTGGGCHNTFLMKRIQEYTRAPVVIPKPEIVDFKEAIVFALLGKLRLEKKVNIYGHITGSHRNSISGCVYLPPVEN
ncbi:MAG: anhydro-N-acetylmuramic acid kinase, partial [Flavobacteriales bacterium]|nr:anhydro-N-acetylmuramic acid kinase [Flavobacteriales bacterium]